MRVEANVGALKDDEYAPEFVQHTNHVFALDVFDGFPVGDDDFATRYGLVNVEQDPHQLAVLKFPCCGYGSCYKSATALTIRLYISERWFSGSLG